MLHLRLDMPAAQKLRPDCGPDFEARLTKSIQPASPLPTSKASPSALRGPQTPPQSPGRIPNFPGPVPKGVEVEFANLSLEGASQAVAEVLAGVPVNDGTLDVVDHKQGRWEVKYDGPNNEIASPILRTASDMGRMLRVIRELRHQGAQSGAGTGLHVHVDGMTFAPAHVTRLVALMAKYEPVIYRAFGVDFERQRLYCRPLPPQLVACLAQAQPRTEAALLGAYCDAGSPNRYFGVNLTNRVPLPDPHEKCTIEFRYFDSDLDERVTQDIATILEHVCQWALRGKDDLDDFGATPKDFCAILNLDTGGNSRRRLVAKQSNWCLLEAMKTMPLAVIEDYAQSLNETVAAHAARELWRFGLKGLQAAKALTDDGSALIRGAARAACADAIQTLPFAELETLISDAAPFVCMQATHHMQMILTSLPCTDALHMCHSSPSRDMLVRHICRNVLTAQSSAVLLTLLDDPKVTLTAAAIEAIFWHNSHVRDPGTRACLWRIHALPQLCDDGRIALLRVLLQSEALPTLRDYVSSLSPETRMSFLQDVRAANCDAPQTVRAILYQLANDTLFTVQVCARSYLRELDAHAS